MAEESETLDQLTPEWRVYQLKRGHRFSNDDKLCAWRAAEHGRHATNVLDLGSGIGSVGLSTLWRLPLETKLSCVEAQSVSVALLRRTVAFNKLSDRVSVVESDLRDFNAETKFDLITGSPPYFAASEGLLSTHSQKAHCRFELRGGLEAYCAAAKRHLAPRGKFVFVMTAADARCETAPVMHGLRVIERYDYRFKGDRDAAHISTLVCEHDENNFFSRFFFWGNKRQFREMVLRDADGRRTLEYRAFQELMALKPSKDLTLSTLEAALADLRTASDQNDLRTAIDNAEKLGMKPTKGSDELRQAKAKLNTEIYSSSSREQEEQ